MLADHQVQTTIHKSDPLTTHRQQRHGGMGAKSTLTGDTKIQPKGVHTGFRFQATGG
jgi:hypothetical protein